MQEALERSKEIWREELLVRVEEVRLEEKTIANERLVRLREEMEDEMDSRISEIQKEDENILNTSLQDLEDGHKIRLGQVHREDKEQGDMEINEIIREHNSKLSQKEIELKLTFANIRTLEEQLKERDGKINELEAKYADSRIEFSHFVDTISGLGGGYTVTKDIL